MHDVRRPGQNLVHALFRKQVRSEAPYKQATTKGFYSCKVSMSANVSANVNEEKYNSLNTTFTNVPLNIRAGLEDPAAFWLYAKASLDVRDRYLRQQSIWTGLWR